VVYDHVGEEIKSQATSEQTERFKGLYNAKQFSKPFAKDAKKITDQN